MVSAMKEEQSVGVALRVAPYVVLTVARDGLSVINTMSRIQAPLRTPMSLDFDVQHASLVKQGKNLEVLIGNNLRVTIPKPMLFPSEVVHLSVELRKIFEYQICTDAEIETQNGNIRCHRVVLYCRAPELIKQANEEGHIKLPQYSKEIVSAMLEYVYSSQVTALTPTTPEAFVTKLSALANEFDLYELVKLCEKYVRKQMEEHKAYEKKILDIKRLIAEEKLAEAESKINEIMAGESSADPRVFALMGSVQILNGLYWNALQSFMHARTFDPENVGYDNAVASIHNVLSRSKQRFWTDDDIKLLVASQFSMLAKSFSVLVNNSQYSDIQLVLHNEKYHAHKLFLCLQSDYFSQLFEDVQENVLILDNVLPNLSPSLLQAVLLFAYTRVPPIFGLSVEQLEILVQVSNFFGYLQLKDACEMRLAGLVNSQNASRLFDLGLNHECSRLVKVSQKVLAKELNKQVLQSFDLSNHQPLEFELKNKRLERRIDELFLVGDAHILENKTIRLIPSGVMKTGAMWLQKRLQFTATTVFRMNMTLQITERFSLDPTAQPLQLLLCAQNKGLKVIAEPQYQLLDVQVTDESIKLSLDELMESPIHLVLPNTWRQAGGTMQIQVTLQPSEFKAACAIPELNYQQLATVPMHNFSLLHGKTVESIFLLGFSASSCRQGAQVDIVDFQVNV